MVLTTYGALSPVNRALLPPSQRNAKHCRELMPASRHQDHTLSPSAFAPFVFRHQSVHRIPRPTFCDDRETPLLRARDGEACKSDLGEARREIFLRTGLDRRLAKQPIGQITARNSALSKRHHEAEARLFCRRG